MKNTTRMGRIEVTYEIYCFIVAHEDDKVDM